MVPHPNFDPYVHPHWLKEFCHFLPEVWLGYNLKESNDPWWQFQAAVGQFNNLRSERIHAYCWKVVDELMSAYRPRTAKLGNLPNISFVMCKPDLQVSSFVCFLFYFIFYFTFFFSTNLPFVSPGTEFKCATCPVMGCMLHLEIQCGKDGMKDAQHNHTLGATAGCSLEGSAGVDSTGHGLRGDAWFSSVKTAMEIGIYGNEAVVEVEANSWLYPKQFIEDALADAPWGISIVLAGIAPNEQRLIAVSYCCSHPPCSLS